MSLPTVLILGASGRLGQAASTAFAASGWRVLRQGRQARAGGPPTLALPLAETAALAEAAAGARVVLHAANPAYTRWGQELLPMARQAMDLAERLDALLLVPGNVYAFGADMPALLSEATPVRPSTAKGALRLQLEQELQARAAAGRLRVRLLRAGDFFGAGLGSWLDLAIAKQLPQGRLQYPGPLDRPHAWAYLPDLAQALVGLAERRGAQGFESWTFEGHTLTGEQLLAGLAQAAQALGWPVPTRLERMPWWPWQLAAPLVPLLREVLAMRYLWERPHALDGGALRQHLGERLVHTPLEWALQASLADLARQGLWKGWPALPQREALA
ncbi:NAD-dependent epimerase/dehydratase family protein [Inhella proteolytica]|uniref:NAD-dependent epimerase/dehydratase family protein n=1 Tax=Inhella proteolytica TaxID=2795029 RepID=A0A931J5W7_9BURK|nr:NAD-dependent epimerase/dehydratase family protein [Inhella proteolytica]MBH9578785.1 NAD-dependent epimerase/dehydratase family protein [Inhella proteolytica]